VRPRFGASRSVHRGRGQFADDHVTLFDDLLQRLATTIEKNARAKLSSRLCRIANAPPGMVRNLAADHESAWLNRYCATRRGWTTPA